jgi:hypothetical protein
LLYYYYSIETKNRIIYHRLHVVQPSAKIAYPGNALSRRLHSFFTPSSRFLFCFPAASQRTALYRSGWDPVDRLPGGLFGHFPDGSFFRRWFLLVGTAPESPADQHDPDQAVLKNFHQHFTRNRLLIQKNTTTPLFLVLRRKIIP